MVQFAGQLRVSHSYMPHPQMQAWLARTQEGKLATLALASQKVWRPMSADLHANAKSTVCSVWLLHLQCQGAASSNTECVCARILDLVYTDVSVPATKPSSDPGTKRVIAAGVNRLHSSETPPTTSACVLMLATHPAACCMAACKITVDLGRMVQPALPRICNTTCWLLAFAPASMAQAHDQGGSATAC